MTTIGVYGGKFFPPHTGHLSFIYQAASKVDTLYVDVQYDLEHEAKLIEGTNFAPISSRERVAWLSEELKDFPNIHVISQYEHRSDEHLTDPLCEQTYKELAEMVGGRIDIIFSNTHEYDEYFNQWLPGVHHEVMLEARDIVNISATEIREKGVYAMWDYLPKAVQKAYLQRVAFVGWESTGKTYTAKALAKVFNTTYIEEYGRTFYEEKGGFQEVDTPADYVQIAAGHLYAHHYANGNRMVMMDTDLIYTQFFYQKQYGELNPILDLMIKAKQDKVDHYIFLEPRNQFVQDGYRFVQENKERQDTSDQLKALYKSYGRTLTVIDEQDDHERLKACERAVRAFLPN